jgi:hypothetical protein
MLHTATSANLACSSLFSMSFAHVKQRTLLLCFSKLAIFTLSPIFNLELHPKHLSSLSLTPLLALFVKRIYRKVKDYGVHSAFYDNLDTVEAMVAEFKSLKGDHVTVNKIDALMETRIDRFNKRYNDVIDRR